MKKLSILFLTFGTLSTLFSQTIEPTNVYPSNLEENMYFEKFDPSTNEIKGLYFMILSDGNNSEHRTPSFETVIYLYPEGASGKEDLIIVKKYELDGIYHFGKHEFSNETISLQESPVAIPAGNYRVGIWINSNEAFDEDKSDNATLFKNQITIHKDIQPSGGANLDDKKEDDGWDNWDDEDTEEDDW